MGISKKADLYWADIRTTGWETALKKKIMKTLLILLGLAAAVTGGLEVRALASTHRIHYSDKGISPASITVTKGDKVKLQIQNNSSKIHNFVIPDFFVFTQNLNPGQSTSVEFDAAKSGSFQFYSDYSPNGAYGTPETSFKGTLTVK